MDLLSLRLRQLVCPEDAKDAMKYSEADVSHALKTARKNKLAVLFERSERSSGTDASPRAEVATIRRDVASANMQVLQFIHTVSACFDTAGIKHAFYKGPLQQKLLYGDFFAKPCSDADVLVSRHQYNEACAVLRSLDFQIPEECKTWWWRHYLGEQPFFPGGRRPHSVDLHHRLQQPGSPAPRHISRFLEDTVKISVGTSGIAVPRMPYIAMIASMNLVKAVYNRHPGGNHALDLLMALRTMTPTEIDVLRSEARYQGLHNTVRVASRLAARSLDLDDLYSQEKVRLPLTVESANGLIFAPTSNMALAPRRSKMLAYLCDAPALDFPVEASRWLTSEMSRLAAQYRLPFA